MTAATWHYILLHALHWITSNHMSYVQLDVITCKYRHYMALHDVTWFTSNYMCYIRLLVVTFQKKGSTSFGCNARKCVLLYVNAWKCMLMLDWVSWSQPSSCAKVISESLARRVFVAQSQQADCLMSRRRGGHCHESSTVCLPPGNDHASESPSECCLECSESIPRRC